MHVRKISVLTLAAVALCLSLTACGNNGTDRTARASSAAASASVAGTASPRTTPMASDSQQPTGAPARTAASGTPNQAGVSCTNQLDYAGDPRSNAEINTIGEQTGYCPPAQHQ
ncbi:hypothetical protein [Actinacidiphila acididurans]|uniref:Secreted protein n=1 Tax=Actinacidiphila acididurans TaxID=2784346 RepID=A0ABS2TJQ0_9ACTN|nr:hypothetical protein [Actinacidiphila acididurans]MBM9503047.1 hypothetical protein [Actinacidiphila acididurans]